MTMAVATAAVLWQSFLGWRRHASDMVANAMEGMKVLGESAMVLQQREPTAVCPCGMQ